MYSKYAKNSEVLKCYSPNWILEVLHWLWRDEAGLFYEAVWDTYFLTVYCFWLIRTIELDLPVYIWSLKDWAAFLIMNDFISFVTFIKVK